MNDFRAIILPYCLKRLEDGTYIVLNRKYKPVGFDTSDFLNYEDYPACHKIKGINKKTAASLSFRGDDDIEMIYLYNDGCVPTHSPENMKKYMEKLAALAKYKIT